MCSSDLTRCWETVLGIWGSTDWVPDRVRVGIDIRYVRRSIMGAFGHACRSEVERAQSLTIGLMSDDQGNHGEKP